MNVEIGTEAAQFPEKEYINVIFLAVRHLDKKKPLQEEQATPHNRVLLIISSDKKRHDVIRIQQSGPSYTVSWTRIPDSVIRTHMIETSSSVSVT
jgi:hypothetical protein